MTGLQVLALPQEMQLIQQENKEQVQQNIQHQVTYIYIYLYDIYYIFCDSEAVIIISPVQVFITPNNQIVINGPDKSVNNNNDGDVTNIVIKEECNDDNNDDVRPHTYTIPLL